jgi:hypothetical protein
MEPSPESTHLRPRYSGRSEFRVGRWRTSVRQPSEGNVLRYLSTKITVALAVTLVLISSGSASAGAVATSTAVISKVTPDTGFVARSGTELTVNGQPWRFAGYNLPCANPFVLSDAQLAFYLDNIKTNSGANAIRVWFFQSQGGPGNWKNFDRVMAALDAHSMRAVVTLTNETSTCDEPSASTLYKTLAWYQGGYTEPEGGYKLSFQRYAEDVAKHFATDPGVALWQLVNEVAAPSYSANGNLTCDEASAATALRTYSDDMVSVIRRVDPNHLINLGTIGGASCGTNGSADYSYVHAGLLDLCEYHDYGAPKEAMPTELVQHVADCNRLGKPMFIGEAGIPANVQPDGTPTGACNPWPSCTSIPVTPSTLAQRASFFGSKISAASQAGIVGYLIWVKSPFYSSKNDGYAISDGDPTEATLTSFGASPPPVLPETPWAAALVAIALAVAGLTVLGARTRRRRRGIGATALAPADSEEYVARAK